MMRKTTVSLAALGLAAICAAASAHPKGEIFLSKFDSNGDGKVTREEFMNASVERFDRMDANSDGKISQDELHAYMQQRQEARRQEKFKKIDANGDGNISRDEYLAHKRSRAERQFSRMDKDSDGRLSGMEFGEHKRPGKHRRGGRIFEHLDKDRDGVVSREESNEGWSNWFAKIDRDGDKVITPAELESYRMDKRKNWKR